MENGGNHPKGSTAILYMSRKLGGRGLKSVENEYKNTKIKAAVKLYSTIQYNVLYFERVDT